MTLGFERFVLIKLVFLFYTKHELSFILNIHTAPLLASTIKELKDFIRVDGIE